MPAGFVSSTSAERCSIVCIVFWVPVLLPRMTKSLVDCSPVNLLLEMSGKPSHTNYYYEGIKSLDLGLITPVQSSWKRDFREILEGDVSGPRSSSTCVS